MPYFVVLTYLVIALLAWGSVIALCASVPRWRGALHYAWRMLAGSLAGLVLANLASIAVGGIPILIGLAAGVEPADPAAQVVAAFALFGFFLGPLLASPLGFLGGALLGLHRAWDARAE
ncbi:MAG TPA: hypothetical protein VF530_12205 [Planctomycetota bacterium]